MSLSTNPSVMGVFKVAEEPNPYMTRVDGKNHRIVMRELDSIPIEVTQSPQSGAKGKATPAGPKEELVGVRVGSGKDSVTYSKVGDEFKRYDPSAAMEKIIDGKK